MLSKQDNELLTRTGPGTPMGEYFRCFWQPVLLSEELPAPDCPPVRVKVLGEALLAFRDSTGQVGLVNPRCPHRGADLYFGRNEDNGLRCSFHGWKFDLTGACVDMPSVPANAGMQTKIRIDAYPTLEAGDFVWAHLGSKFESKFGLPVETRDPAARDVVAAQLPELEFAQLPASHRIVQKKLQECNWAQSVEGALDTAHFSFLHMPAPSVPLSSGATTIASAVAQANADQQRLAWMRDDPIPQFTVLEHSAGFVAGAARQTGGEMRYWRISQFMLPNHSLAPNALVGETYQGQTWVPIDDESCWIYCYAWNPLRPLTEQERNKIAAGHGVFAALGANYLPLRNRANEYQLDRADQKRASFTGVRGVAEQDAMIQDSLGRIADRSLEHLGPTDLAIVRFRRAVLGGAKALVESGLLPAAAADPAAYRLRGGSVVAYESEHFETVMMSRFGDSRGRVR